MRTTLHTGLIASCLSLLTVSVTCGQGFVSHSGAHNPATEGFSQAASGTFQTSALTNDLGMGAWSILVNQGMVHYGTSLGVISNQSWGLNITMRVVTLGLDVSGGVFACDVLTGNSIFYLLF